MIFTGKRKSFSAWRQAHIRFGKRGEDIACRTLTNLGLEILCRNYSGPHGEIDVVARDGSVLCFIEVKTRRHSFRSRPADAVTIDKKRKIIRTARRYLRRIGHPPIVFRFDIVEVVFARNRLAEVRHWPNEFSANEG